MIEMVDGSVIAQMGVTDMRHAIQYALTYPERHTCELPPLDLTAVSTLHFEAPDLDRFPCIRLAYRALATGGTMPTAMNAANEEAVASFIDGRLGLTDIPQVISTVMDLHPNEPASDIQTILDADCSARLQANAEIEKLTSPSSVLEIGRRAKGEEQRAKREGQALLCSLPFALCLSSFALELKCLTGCLTTRKLVCNAD